MIIKKIKSVLFSFWCWKMNYFYIRKGKNKEFKIEFLRKKNKYNLEVEAVVLLHTTYLAGNFDILYFLIAQTSVEHTKVRDEKGYLLALILGHYLHTYEYRNYTDLFSKNLNQALIQEGANPELPIDYSAGAYSNKNKYVHNFYKKLIFFLYDYGANINKAIRGAIKLVHTEPIWLHFILQNGGNIDNWEEEPRWYVIDYNMFKILFQYSKNISNVIKDYYNESMVSDIKNQPEYRKNKFDILINRKITGIYLILKQNQLNLGLVLSGDVTFYAIQIKSNMDFMDMIDINEQKKTDIQYNLNDNQDLVQSWYKENGYIESDTSQIYDCSFFVSFNNIINSTINNIEFITTPFSQIPFAVKLIFEKGYIILGKFSGLYFFQSHSFSLFDNILELDVFGGLVYERLLK